MKDDTIGGLAGLGAALAWAIGSVIFSRVPVPASAINLFKNGFATVLLLGVLLVLAVARDAPVLHPQAEPWGWLAASALVGLVVGDTCYFRSLQILGPRRALILTTLAPPCSALLGWVLLGEDLPATVWGGMAICLAGIAVVIAERTRVVEAAGHFPGTAVAGVAYGLVGSLCQAFGATFSKIGMSTMSHPGLTLEASFVRLLVAACVGVLLALGRRQLGGWLTLYFRTGSWRWLAPASVSGTAIGIWLSLVAFRNTELGIATTLTSMTPVFVLPLVRIFLAQPVTVRAVTGALVALAGVAVMFVEF